jgi:hypothetical protein
MTTRAGKVEIVPFLPEKYFSQKTGTLMIASGSPGSFLVPSASPSVIRKYYNVDRDSTEKDAPFYANLIFVRHLEKFVVTPCFARPLPSNK